MNKKAHKIALFSFNVLFFSLAAIILPVLFEDNDDITMAWIASGIYSGTPDCHLVFINAIWGKMLAWLYTFIPSLEWYSIGFAVLQIVSMTVIINFGAEVISDKCTRISLSVLFYLFWLLIIIRFQFTTTAAITAFAGTLLLYKKKFLKGGILLLLGSMVRYSAAGLVGLLMAPALIWSFKLDIKKAYLPLLFVLLAVFCIHKADSLFYNSPEWKYYREFNSIRGMINDNPNLWRAVGHLPENISENEFLTVAAFAIDPTVTTIDDLKQIFDSFNNTPIYKKAKNIFPKLVNEYWDWIIVLTAFLLIPGILGADKKRIWISLFISIFWFAILSGICLNGSVKFRVFLSAIFPILFYGGMMYGEKNNGKRKWGIRYIPIILIWAMLSVCIIKQRSKINSKVQAFDEQLELVNRVNNMTIIPIGADYMVEMYPPFKLYKSVATCSFINPYCMMASPLNAKYDSYNDIVDSDLCFLANKKSDLGNYLEALYDNYKITADTTHIAETANYCITKITSTIPE